MDRAAEYRYAIECRRAFHLPGYTTLDEAGFDGPYVSPIQISSGNLDGPMFVTKDWFDLPSARDNREVLIKLGYMPGIPFNAVLDLALGYAGLNRGDIYITPIFTLLTPVRSHPIGMKDRKTSFEAVGQHELMGRRPIAAGSDAASVLRSLGVPHVESIHPSARGMTYEERARRIAKALESA